MTKDDQVAPRLTDTYLDDTSPRGAPVFRAGRYVFVGPTIGTDADGRLVDGDDNGFTQALVALRRVELGLEDFGLGLGDLLQTRMYSSPAGGDAVIARGAVMREAGALPSALGFRVIELEKAPAVVEVGGIAVVPDGSRRGVEDLSEFGRRGAYSSAVRAGNHVLISGTVAADAVGKIEADDPAGQARVLIDRFSGMLEELGGSLADIVLTRIYLHHLRDLDAVAAVHAERFGAIRPVTTVMEAYRFGGDDTFVKLEAEAIIGTAEREEAGADNWAEAGCSGLVATDEQIFVAGRTAIEEDGVEAQLEALLGRLEADLRRHGCALDDVAQIHSQVTDADGAQRVRTLLDERLRGPVAAPVLIVREIARPGAKVQIDARAFRGGE